MVDEAEIALNDTPGVIGDDSLQLRWIGHQLHAEPSVQVDGTLDLQAAHAIAHEAQDRLCHHVPKLTEVTVHVGPPAAQDG
ncbi:cation transporter dimerization domain-containing protein [Aeromicrobium sp. A1-2]|uniref:cation transporter dimerization domain-containing protein n=1 Tax=Aeromicrobium sp. A1-2 TaxID=2107713 RepID=UPI00352DF013